MTADRLVSQDNRRRAEAEARIDSVLEVAAQLFLQRGYSHTSLNDIVSRAGVYEQILLGVRKSVTNAEIRLRVERAVKIFLTGIQPP